MTVHTRQFRLRGWTIALTTARSRLDVTLTRPHPLDPYRWDGPQPALALTLHGGLTDTHATDPTPERVDLLRRYPRRLWQRWAHRHPDAADQPGTLTVGPWTATLDRRGLDVRRLPEYDCPWHAPIPDDDCYPEGWCGCASVPDTQPDADACTCPRIRPWLSARLLRPELLPVDPPF